MHQVFKKINSRILVFLFLLLLSWGCSTQKNTFVSRNFHSITTKYNGYFNGRESYIKGLQQLDKVHEDNYEDILSIFRYGSPQQATLVAGNMDLAYQKASVAIRKHSMNIKGIEYNRWIDDSYYLIARSHYFKGDINLAVLTFQYIIRQFDTPLKYKSKIWVAKSYIKNKEFNNALPVLEALAKDSDEGLLDKEALLLYNMVYADFHLRQQNFSQAIPYLDFSAGAAPKRKLRARLTYILAQAYHKEENYAMAQQTYRKVLKLNPEFQMAFQSRINMAMAFDVKSGDSSFILSELKGMLRSNENKEFRDQIYYALAQLSIRQNNEKQAIEYYNLSLENYRGNKSQKGITFLRLGEISFTKKDYINAAMYYDSTMTYLSPVYPEFEAAGKKNVILKEMSSNLLRIQREDSLQAIARLSTDERNARLDLIIAELLEKERLEKEKEQERALMRQQMARSGRGQTPGAGEGGWYFYNPSAINFGRNEFYAKWGERQLEDLWRISNKRVIAFGETASDLDPMDGEEKDQTGRVTRSSLMQNIPNTPEKLKTSDQRIAQSYYNVALIFKDKLNNESEAIRHFETLVSRFPENENKLLSAYFLYVLLNQSGNPVKADVYRNMIIRDFPDTDFARILSDPNYRENITNRQNRIKELYARAYHAYDRNDFKTAMDIVKQSQTDSLDVSREQAAQFAFLKALIFAKTDSHEMLIEQLTYVTQNFTQTNVHEPATNLLAYLGSGARPISNQVNPAETPRSNNVANQQQTVSQKNSIFSYSPNSVHFYVMVVNTREVQIRQLRSDIDSFNKNSFPENNLNMSTLFFNQNQQLITITNFPDATQALSYGQKMINAMNAKEYNSSSFNGFAISVDNYPVFYQERKLDEYLDFFNNSYSGIK
jgi:tetratricopeptide (TPR) repeat protein